MKLSIFTITLIIVCISAAMAGTDRLIFNDEFTALYTDVIINHPDLSALKKRLDGDKLNRVASLFPPDPTFQAMTGTMMTELTIAQKIGDPAMYLGRYQMANAELTMTSADRQKLLGAILYSLKESYLKIYQLHKTVQIVEKHIELITVMERQTLSRMRTGANLQNKLLLLQIEREQLRDTRRMAGARLQAAQNDLQAQSGYPVMIDASHTIAITDIGDLTSDLVNWPVTDTAMYTMSKAALIAERSKLSMAVAGVLPDLAAGAMIQVQYSGKITPMFMGMLSVPLYFPKNILEIGDRQKNVSASRERLNLMEYTLTEKLNSLLIMIDSNDQSRELYNGLLREKALQNYDQITRQSATSQTVDITLVLEAFRKMLQLDLKAIELTVNRELAVARLEQFFSLAIDDLIEKTGKIIQISNGDIDEK